MRITTGSFGDCAAAYARPFRRVSFSAREAKGLLREVSPHPFLIMGHHSQFKCLSVVSSTLPDSPPHHVTVAELEASNDYTLNRCTAVGAAPPLPDGSKNPTDPVLACEHLEPSTVDDEGLTAVWGVVNYTDYDGDAYVWGCVNECAEFKDTCPGFDPAAPENTHCDGVVEDFGRLVCGCNTNFGGPACDYACAGTDPRVAPDPAGNLFVDLAYQLAPRRGYWLCARPSASESVEMRESGEPGVGYSLRGEVPLVVTPTTPLCEEELAPTDGGPPTCSGYSISASVISLP